MKLGRNDPCSCGSGLKFKKCCGTASAPLLVEKQAGAETLMARSVEAHQSGQLEEAAQGYRQVIKATPGNGNALHLLGVVEYQLGNFSTAIDLIKKAIPYLPGIAEVHINLGAAYMDSGQFDEAAACFNKALSIQPLHPKAYMNLGKLFSERLILDKALESYRQALSVSPNNMVAYSSFLFILLYDPKQTLASLAEAHQEWAQLVSRQVQGYTDYKNGRNPERILRIGYVSPDFGRHPVGYFLLPVLKAHDREKVRVYCYSNRIKEDEITGRLKNSADEWLNIAGKDDREIARQIRNDRIDILVDLAGHTAGNSLSLFAIHPAPLQVTWAGYMGTTGLRQMDYILTNRHATPPGTEKYYSERFLFLPDDYICYEPPDYAPPVAGLPALTNGVVTFGCFNNLAKVNEKVVSLWARLLKRLPGSRLVLTTKQLDNAEICRRYAEMFEARGVADRVHLEGSLPHKSLLEKYHRIDISLDPFPYTGALSTLESLWMGVPVVTLAGEIMVGRQSLCHVVAVGMNELIAKTEEDYLRIAEELANDLPRLSSLRSGLRGRMKETVCDEFRFTASLEAAFQDIWRNWCISTAN